MINVAVIFIFIFIFKCKKDSNIISLNLTSQPIVTMPEKSLEIKQ